MPENFQNEYQQEDEPRENSTPQIISENTPSHRFQEGMSVQPDSLGKGQKIAAAFLGLFAIFVLVFWGVQFKRSISDPLAYKGDNTEGNSSLYQEDTEESLKSKDTDKDGLNDWEELNIYQTSPYLDDSDSDGYKDKEEIDNGNDPTCPVGRDCYGSTVSDLEKEVPDPEEEVDNTQENTETSIELNQEETEILSSLLNGNASVEEIRQILKEYGINEVALNNLSDEQIMSIYQETLLSN